MPRSAKAGGDRRGAYDQTDYPPSAPVDPLLKDREGAALLGMSVPTFWRRVADGTIPRPIKLGGLSRWPQSEIEAVIVHAKAARGQSAS